MATQNYVVSDSALEFWLKALNAHTFYPSTLTHTEYQAVIEELIASRKVHRAALRLASKWSTRSQQVDIDDFYAEINAVCEAVDTVPKFPIL